MNDKEIRELSVDMSKFLVKQLLKCAFLGAIIGFFLGYAFRIWQLL